MKAAGHPDIVSVFPDSVLQLHTTRSWDFLETERRILRASATYNKHVSSDVIIGMIDTGIYIFHLKSYDMIIYINIYISNDSH